MQLTVIRKISLGFGLFGCLLLLTSILSYFGLKDIRASAFDVVEVKMPVQAKMVDVKTDILSLSTITANGFHEDTVNSLTANREQFVTLSAQFLSQINALKQNLANNGSANDAVTLSQKYVAQSKKMYDALMARIRLENAIQTKLESVLMAADEASALMLDLSYLDPDIRGVQTLIGAGTNIDNKLLTMNTAFSELAATSDPQVTTNIVTDLEYQLSNLLVDKDYINRLAEGIDDGGTVAAFNEQYDTLLTELQGEEGLIALQQEKLDKIDASSRHRKAANSALDGALANINTLFDNVSSSTLEGQNAILESVQNNLVKNVVVAVIGLAAAFVLAIIATRSIARPLARINRGLSQLSKGDLTVKLENEGNDEFSALSAKVNSLADSLRDLVGNILAQEKQLVEVTKQSVALGEHSLKNVDAQREKVTETSENTQNIQNTSHSNLAQIEEAMAALNTVSQQSQAISSLVRKNRDQANNQATQAESSAQVINRLDENSRNIGSILDVIKTIAEQTNLLALNAAIEAARAGEQGRGFAVVADEVRTLATRTQNSTEEIEAMIDSLQRDAQQAVSAISEGREQASESVQITEQVNEQVGSISAIIEKLSQINSQIVNDTQQQDVLLADVAQTLTTIVELADSSAQSTRQANESTMKLDAQMNSLRNAVERFKL
ncbi:methyl-accepting chemotaxis protein [Alteromonas halophila]|uniref:Methyl-accepting chemotaxis protein n=1 Tax=Alteromonas halophila TaxID=516698 RepID=A0A918JM04_9ALTE|nr:methyl-accepting chemotaxis protein [Alteromonas halophila]GGW88896.1 methyl-accepting chemotaxis protein [Alteromonas halophila]